MVARVGVGIITYNRRDVLLETLDRVQAHTTSPFTLMVADDGSEDGTARILRERNIRVVTGRNMGIAWNKNRALFFLCGIIQCDAIILLEDDSFPIKDGWEQDWLVAAQKWGHANVAGEWFRNSFLRGTGTPDDPIMSKDITAQCSVFSRESLLYGGYFDPRFRGFGQEHVEHTRRLVRVGFGGTYEEVDGQVVPIYRLLWGGIHVRSAPTFANPVDTSRNLRLCRELLFEEGYRAPWRDDAELAQLRAEMALALRTP